jgi:hypothetical protein
LGGLNETAGAVRVFFEIHVSSLGLPLCPWSAQMGHRQWATFRRH